MKRHKIRLYRRPKYLNISLDFNDDTSIDSVDDILWISVDREWIKYPDRYDDEYFEYRVRVFTVDKRYKNPYIYKWFKNMNELEIFCNEIIRDFYLHRCRYLINKEYNYE
jgi:hypothetical protein